MTVNKLIFIIDYAKLTLLGSVCFWESLWLPFNILEEGRPKGSFGPWPKAWLSMESLEKCMLSVNNITHLFSVNSWIRYNYINKIKPLFISVLECRHDIF